MEGLRGGLSLLFSLNKAEVEDDNFELQEEDMWCNYKPKEEQDSGSKSNPKKNLNYPFDLALATTLSWSIPIVPKIILRAKSGGSGGRQEPTPSKVAASRTSTPIPIPNWSKIYPLNPNKELWEATYDLEKALVASKKQVGFIDFVEPDDDGGEFIPPHIILARREALAQCISHSMIEGVGRTLKGRDLTDRRNSILKLTGFIEN
ncbi:unnamed protein product [Fraxinus pennsylvanica]|uniref:Uncharacterized protein n=1 Tax=Fraxinus pennsylvanica TaxID=56036 RepID=A0AAD2A9E1_9LAMI|nr:unnamed protein product [Fraxinus pennsylvanica]